VGQSLASLALLLGLGLPAAAGAQAFAVGPGNWLKYYPPVFAADSRPPAPNPQPPAPPPPSRQQPNPQPPAPPQGVLQVGPGRAYPTISAAVGAANTDTNLNNAYDVQVLPGTYTNDFPTITRPVTIEVDPCCAGQAVVLNATIDLTNDKGIILALANLTVNGLTFTGAHISDGLGGNGAGIRDQNQDPAAKLIIMNSIFENNQEGVLTGDNDNQIVMVSNSSFINNGNPNQSVFQHGIYVNSGALFSVSNSLFCGQLIGHSVKSRAAVTTVTGSQIYDGAQGPSGCEPGSSSLAIDVANGGTTTITSNQLIQGASSQNFKLVDYGEEGLIYTSNSLVFSGNTFSSMGTPSATAVYDPQCVPAQFNGDTFTGITTQVDPAGCLAQ
jgi:hypothetical protein